MVVPLPIAGDMKGSGSGSAGFIGVIRAVFGAIFDPKKDAGSEKPEFLRFDPADPAQIFSKPDAENLGPTCQFSAF